MSNLPRVMHVAEKLQHLRESVVFVGGGEIKLISAPYFVAAKFEAFRGRGNQDYLGSHDMEDIITILDGNKNLLIDVLKSNKALKEYYKQIFIAFQNDINFLRVVPGHLTAYKGVAAQRIEKIEELINQFSNLTV